MKYFCVLFILLSLPLSAQVISFIPEGPMDKPLPDLEIRIDDPGSKSCADFYKRHTPGPTVYVFYIDKDSFDDIACFIVKVKTDVVYDVLQKNSYKYGTYHIKYSTQEKQVDYIIYPHKKSFQFFKELLTKCKSNEGLYEEINVLLKRLD